MKKTLGVVLARGGSKGVPRKNLVSVLGRPMVAWTIEAGQRAKTLTHLVLSTEDQEIGSVGSELGVEVVLRPDDMATDTAPMDWALRHAVRIVEAEAGAIDFVVTLYGCVPVRKPGIVDEVVEKLDLSGADSVETYTCFPVPPQWSFIMAGDKPIPLQGCHKSEYRRQNLAPAYYPDGAVLAVRRSTLMNTEGAPAGSDDFLGRDRRAVVQAYGDTVNVDNLEDLPWAEFLLSRSLGR
jgi:N-acylneuraminate cytidylyltransferase